MLELVLSIAITFGAGGLTGGFNECPPATQPDVVAASADANTTTTTTTVKQSKKS